jgi:fibronectin-binding autotransporter adhesin
MPSAPANDGMDSTPAASDFQFNFNFLIYMQTTKNIFKSAWLCAALLSFSFGSAQAATITNADVPDNLNLGTSWVGGTPAGSGDVALWNNVVQANPTKSLGADTSWAGIQILDPGQPITINAGNTLTLGASGIDMSRATNGLTLACPIVLGAGQIWNVTNGLTLTVSGVVSGSGPLTLNNVGNNGGSIVLSTANTFTGGTLVNSGTVQPNNASSFGTGTITNNGGRLLLSSFPSGGIIANSFYFTGTNIIDAALLGQSDVLDGSWSGNGTVLITNAASGVTLTCGGNGNGGGSFAGFTGSLVVVENNSGTPSAGTIRFNNGGANNNLGNASMSFNLGQGSVHFTEKNNGATTSFGALFGGPNTQLAQQENYVIGALNLPNDTFSGTSTGGTSTFTKNGTGVFTWNNTSANTYSGLTTINTGILQIGDGVTAAAGSLGSGAIVINASGTLTYNKPDAFTVANNISGAGSLIKTNTSAMTYTGNDTSSGTAIVNQGTLSLVSPGTMSGAIFVASNATFDVSQTTFNLSSTLSGFGTVNGLVTAVGGSINPGATGSAGTLTFANGLTESGSVNNQLVLSTPAGTNDLINVIGNLTLTGNNNISLSDFTGGAIPVGTYPLIAYSGTLSGGTSNFTVTAVGVTATLTNITTTTPPKIAVIISAGARGPTTLTWKGDGVLNNWDTTSSNWLNGATLFNFQAGDSARFDATGSANPTVNLAATLLPASVVVSNAASYTFTGNGGIGGSTGLIKTNSGTLNVLTTNSYTGPTVIGGGTLVVSYLANSTLSSGIGAASSDPSNLVFYGATLSYTGPTAGTDHGATLNGSGGTFDVIGGTVLTNSGVITGTGALTLVDTGTLTLANANTYSGGTILSNGVLALGSNGANNNGAGGSGVGPTNAPVTFRGGTLQLYGVGLNAGNNYNTFYNPLVVPAGQSGTLIMFPRGQINAGTGAGLNSSLSGGGTLNLDVNYVRDALSGDWSAFTGLIIVSNLNASGDEMRINNNFGYANAAIYLNGTFTMDSALTAGATINIGELGGISTVTIGPGAASQPNPTWVVGWKNTTNTFAGTIANDGTTSITKVGTGAWILSGQNTYAGSTTISNGVLVLTNGVNGDGSIANSTNIWINSGAVLDVSSRSDGTLAINSAQFLSGSGTIRGILDNTAGGTVSPGGGINGGTGTLTVTTNINMNGGGTAWLKLNRAASTNSDRLLAPAIVLGGNLIVTNIGTALHVGDTFTLFTGALSGSFGSVTLPDAYTWNTSQLSASGKITVAGAIAGPVISRVDYSQLANGTLTFTATNGTPNATYYILTSTNIALPLSSWTTIQTGNYDGNGNITALPVTVNPALPQSFYLLKSN